MFNPNDVKGKGYNAGVVVSGGTNNQPQFIQDNRPDMICPFNKGHVIRCNGDKCAWFDGKRCGSAARPDGKSCPLTLCTCNQFCALYDAEKHACRLASNI